MTDAILLSSIVLTLVGNLITIAVAIDSRRKAVASEKRAQTLLTLMRRELDARIPVYGSKDR